ncbi:SLOG family protein [Microbispora sp. NPDC049125]|uniref:SLOG family protein n=1 Tax=Microbispora sp. NPDC049125 TaxID=3154929 RepID=UPI003464F002
MTAEAFNLLFTASREFQDVQRAWARLDEVLARHGVVHLMHGDYKRRDGKLISDAIAAAWAARRISEGAAVTVEPVPAPWDAHPALKRTAGLVRDGYMPGLLVGRGVRRVGCLAYIVGGSSGAGSTAAFADHVGIPTQKIEF